MAADYENQTCHVCGEPCDVRGMTRCRSCLNEWARQENKKLKEAIQIGH